MKTFECLVCNQVTKSGASKKNIYCSNTCQMKHKRTQILETWLAGEYQNKHGKFPGVAKDYIYEQQGSQCGLCGIKDWNGSPIVMQADHIDGDSANLKPDNLRMICPNCHSQTETWGRKNKFLKMDTRNVDRRLRYNS